MMHAKPSTSSDNAPDGHDIIGDVHGQRKMLEVLLDRMGYAPLDGVWAHPARRAVFVGDIIDKGPDPAETLRMVRAMVDAGTARLVVGNHELNWISACWRVMGERSAFLEGTRRLECRRRLAQAFDDDTDVLMDMVGWLQRQPIFIDEPGLRVVHASWHAPSLKLLEAEGIHCLDAMAMSAYQNRYSSVHLALDRLIAGAEHWFDKRSVDDGYRSMRRRVYWWPGGAAPVHEMELPPAPASDRGYPDSAPPVFFGHYALAGPPRPLGDNVACLDYAAAYGGPLVSYRHVNDGCLSAERFMQVTQEEPVRHLIP